MKQVVLVLLLWVVISFPLSICFSQNVDPSSPKVDTTFEQMIKISKTAGGTAAGAGLIAYGGHCLLGTALYASFDSLGSTLATVFTGAIGVGSIGTGIFVLSLAWEPKLFADAELNTSEHLFWLTTNYDVKLQAASQSPNNIILKNDFLHTDLKLAEYKRWFLMEKMHPKNSETQQELLVLDQKIEELKKQYEDLIKSFYLLPDQDQALLISDAKKVKAQMKKEYVEDEIIKKNQLILKAIQERSLTMYFNNNLIEVVMCA